MKIHVDQILFLSSSYGREEDNENPDGGKRRISRGKNIQERNNLPGLPVAV
jgi:hypothetical protein